MHTYVYVNKASALWKSGRQSEATVRFGQVLETLRAMRPLADPRQAVRKAVLEHSVEHNLGLIFKEHGTCTHAHMHT